MIKQWFTAQELLELGLTGMPGTKRGINWKATEESWPLRERLYGRGGGIEYHISALPTDIRIELVEKLADVSPAALDMENSIFADAALAASERRRDARVLVLKGFAIFKAESTLPEVKAMAAFTQLYNLRGLPALPGWVYETYPSITWPTMRRWFEAREKQDFSAFGGKYGNRAGTGFLDTAKCGEIKAFVQALIVKNAHFSAEHIRDAVCAKFGNEIDGRQLPDIRTFRRFIAGWKAQNADLYTKMTDPDAFKNRYSAAAGRADAGIVRLNQLWEIDASPADVLLNDGRHSIYAVIDVWSRRMKAFVTKTPRSEAALVLIRHAIMDWGVPENIKTDNGKDFVSRRFTVSVEMLGINQEVTPPFSPERKPHIERGIGTLQRDLMPLLPGFIGHNVADRKQIEARKAFAQRLGESEEKAFAVGLTATEMQAYLDDWCANRYQHKPHSGLDGQTPFTRAASWPQAIRRIENERGLDLLLAPLASGESTRIVTKKGIKIENVHFFDAALARFIGQTVFVRHDPVDLGSIYVFSDAGASQFICRAVNMALEGATQGMLAQAKARAGELGLDIAHLGKTPRRAEILAVVQAAEINAGSEG